MTFLLKYFSWNFQRKTTYKADVNNVNMYSNRVPHTQSIFKNINVYINGTAKSDRTEINISNKTNIKYAFSSIRKMERMNINSPVIKIEPFKNSGQETVL